MTTMTATVLIRLKDAVLDPQGQTIELACRNLGLEGVGRTRVGKIIELELTGADEDAIRGTVERLCQELLVNPVIEDSSYRLAGEGSGARVREAGAKG